MPYVTPQITHILQETGVMTIEPRKQYPNPKERAPQIYIALSAQTLEKLKAIQASRTYRNTTSSTARMLMQIGIKIWDIGGQHGIRTSKDLNELMQRTEAAAAAMQAEREALKATKRRTKKRNDVKPPAVLLLSGTDTDAD